MPLDEDMLNSLLRDAPSAWHCDAVLRRLLVLSRYCFIPLSSAAKRAPLGLARRFVLIP